MKEPELKPQLFEVSQVEIPSQIKKKVTVFTVQLLREENQFCSVVLGFEQSLTSLTIPVFSQKSDLPCT